MSSQAIAGLTKGIGEPEWTIESIKLSSFNPLGLEVDEEERDVDVGNPYMTNPIKRDDSVEEHKRPWHGSKYYLPNDEAELSRLDRQHIIWRHILDGDLVKAPVKDAKYVLDLGTGSGIWAMEFAMEHPNSQVLGIDLTKPTPQGIPNNCTFEQRDFMEPWPDSEKKFDYIHGRLIFVGQSNPRQLLQNAYDALAPGGYLEFHDLYGVPLAPDSSLRGRFAERFFVDAARALDNLGIDGLALPKFAGWMRELGFEGVVEEQRALPFSSWPKGKYKEVGAMQAENMKVGTPGIYTRMLIQGLGWSPEKTAEAIARVIEEVGDRSMHAYFPVFVVYGRKPSNAIGS